MIAGANYLLYFKKPDMFENISKIIYTFSQNNEIIKQYTYPESDYITLVDDEVLAVALTQQDTIDLQGRISIEAQYIYGNTSVVKTERIDKYIKSSAFTEIIPGNFPSLKDNDVILPAPEDMAVIVVGGVKDYNKLENKPEEITALEVADILNRIGGLV